MTKPPPKLSAPTLNAVHDERAQPGGVRREAARLIGPARPVRRSTSTPPQATSASTTNGPASALAAAPAGRVDGPAAVAGGAGRPAPRRRRQVERRPQRDRGHGRPAARAGGPHPVRRRRGQEQPCQGDDDRQAGKDEPGAADERPAASRRRGRAEDRELGRRRPREQVAGRDRVFELVGRDPPAALDAKLAQEHDVGRRPAEPDHAQPRPLPGDGAERLSRGRRHAASSASRATGASPPSHHRPVPG